MVKYWKGPLISAVPFAARSTLVLEFAREALHRRPVTNKSHIDSLMANWMQLIICAMMTILQGTYVALLLDISEKATRVAFFW